MLTLTFDFQDKDSVERFAQATAREHDPFGYWRSPITIFSEGVRVKGRYVEVDVMTPMPADALDAIREFAYEGFGGLLVELFVTK